MMRCSRLMSWAVASTCPSGGRRSTQFPPAVSVTLNVRFEWPPAIRSKVSGGAIDGTWSTNHCVTRSKSTPSTSCTGWSTGSTRSLVVRKGHATAVSFCVVTIDVTYATFETEVLARSEERPVVVDLWAPWCGPCKLLGPILEDVIDATDGQIVLAKVDIDQNPQVQAAFRVQGIPAVFALPTRAVVDSFIGAKGHDDVRAFVDRLLPSAEQNAIN